MFNDKMMNHDQVEKVFQFFDLKIMLKNIKEYYEEHEDINDPIWKLYNDLILIHDKYDACADMLKLFDYFIKQDYIDIKTDEEREATKDLPLFSGLDEVNVERSVVDVYHLNFNSLVIADVKDRTIKSIIDGEDIVLKIGRINHDRDRYKIWNGGDIVLKIGNINHDRDRFKICNGDIIGETLNQYSFRTVHNKKKVYAQLLYYYNLLIDTINNRLPDILEYVKTHKYDNTHLYGIKKIVFDEHVIRSVHMLITINELFNFTSHLSRIIELDDDALQEA